jgi:hypothetical protein
MQLTVTRASERGEVVVHATGEGANPLLPVAPAIDYEVSIMFDFSRPDAVLFNVLGDHDAFPNYEIYIGGRAVYQYGHGQHGPSQLFPPLEKAIAEVGALPWPK